MSEALDGNHALVARDQIQCVVAERDVNVEREDESFDGASGVDGDCACDSVNLDTEGNGRLVGELEELVAV